MHNDLEKYIEQHKDAFNNEVPTDNIWNIIEKKFFEKETIKSENDLERIIVNKKDEFNADEPSSNVWNKIETSLNQKNKTKIFAIKPIYKWSIAAAAVILLISTIYFKWLQKPDVPTNNLATEKLNSDTNNIAASDTQKIENENGNTELVNNNKTENEPIKQVALDNKKQTEEVVEPVEEPQYSSVKTEEVVLAELITKRQNKLKNLTKDNTYLYQEFSADMKALESNYSILKTQLKNTSNTDVIIKAMMQNLQLQAELLNRQLSIIKNIKPVKKDEKVNSINM